MPPEPPALPRLFIDRSVGRLRVPHLLRAAGLDVLHLSEHYGESQAQRVRDVDWLAEVGRHGWAVLMKDARIRRDPAERAALVSAGVRAFVLGKGTGDQQAERVLANLAAMSRACASSSGPFVLRIHPSRLERLRL